MDEALTRYEALVRCRDLAGSDSQMARDLNVSQPKIWRWINQSRQMQIEYVLAAERKYGVSRHHLRPDIYPIEHGTESSRWNARDQCIDDRHLGLDSPDRHVSFHSPTILKGACL